MTVYYEWDIEQYETGVPEAEAEIIDHHHASALQEFNDADLREALQPGSGRRLVLVRDQRDKNDALDRSWAYVVDRRLPDMFRDAFETATVRVPFRHHGELRQRLAAMCQ